MSTNIRERGVRSAATRARILDAALELFNERGTAAVSTNHIAAQAGLSPGNLYYHFSDKREIIRELQARYAAGFEDRWTAGPDAAANMNLLRANLIEGMRQAWQYRFFERETLALLRADPDLRAQYLRVRAHRLQQWSAFAAQLAEQGLLRRPRPPVTITDVNTAIWLIAGSWLPFLDASGEADEPDRVVQGTQLVLAVLDPYLTAKGRRALGPRTGGDAGQPSSGGCSGQASSGGDREQP